MVCLLSCSIAELVWGYSMVGRVAPSGDGASVLWGALGLDCYARLWCVSGSGWGIPDQVKNVLIIIFFWSLKFSEHNADEGLTLVSFSIAIWTTYSNFKNMGL